MESKTIEDSIASFELGSGPHHVILLHGYPLSPHDVRLVGEGLARAGFHVIAPLLPGFGRNYEYLYEHSDWKEWVAEIDRQIKLVSTLESKSLFVSGFSLGGTMTLWTAIHHPEVKALAPICGPVHVKGMIKWLIPILKKLTKFVPNNEEIGDANPSIANDPVLKELDKRYNKIVLNAIHSELKLMKHVRNNLQKITQPILICQGRLDTNIPEDNSDVIYKKVSSEQKQIKYYENSGHFLPYEEDKEEMVSDIVNFFKAHI